MDIWNWHEFISTQLGRLIALALVQCVLLFAIFIKLKNKDDKEIKNNKE